MRKESWLDIRILKTPEVDQPENLERIQENPKQRKVQENLGVSGFCHLRNPPQDLPP